MTWLRLVSDKKGRWNDPLTMTPPQYSNWKRGKYAETDDNCAFLLSGDKDKDGKWSSGTCTEQSPRLVFIIFFQNKMNIYFFFLIFFRSLCTMCQFRQSFNKFTLRGLCLDSKHDTVYFLERTPGAMPYFKGLSSSIIRWNVTRNTWILNHLRYTAPAYLAEDPVVRVVI